MKIFLRSLICLLIATSPLAHAWQPQSIVVFGDSLSDNGNKYQTYHLPASPPYWHGRYSNGPIWAENLAYQFNLIDNPALQPDYPRDQLLRDYAMGDSVIMKSHLNSNSDTLSLLQQLDKFKSQPLADPHNTLAIIWDGSNDFKNQACLSSPFVCVKSMIHIQNKVINKLYEAGIRHFLLISQPNITITPESHAHDSATRQEIVSGLIKYYNNNLALMVSQLQNEKDDIYIMKFDINPFIADIRNKFNQPLQLACYQNQGIYSHPVTEPCPIGDQNEYFFWDTTHPTTAVHALLANHLYDVIKTAKW